MEHHEVLERIVKNDFNFIKSNPALAKVDWQSLCFSEASGDAIIETLTKSLPNIMSNDAPATRVIFKEIICPLFSGPKDLDSVSPERREQVFTLVHKLLESFIGLTPHASKLVLRCLKHGTPYYASPVKHLFPLFIGNLVRTVKYLDVHDQSLVVRFVTDKLFLVDISCLNTSDGSQQQVLDGTLHSVVTSIGVVVKENDTLDMSRGHTLLEQFFTAFCEIILPSNKCAGSQFAIFYLASLDEKLSGKFVQNLMFLLNNNSENVDLTINAVCYLASFLTASTSASVNDAMLFVQWSANYLQEYLDEASEYLSSSSSPVDSLDTGKHRVFYVTFQAVISVICSRCGELKPSHCAVLQACDFQRLINSPLNPLAVCSDELLSSFMTVSTSLKIALCSAIIHRNCRSDLSHCNFTHCQLVQPFSRIELPLSCTLVSQYMRPSA